MHTDNWPTKEADLKIAKDIINKYIDFNDGKPLGLFEIAVNMKEPVNLKISDWLIELSDYYHKCYGSQQGEQITRMVMTRCIIRGATIH